MEQILDSIKTFAATWGELLVAGAALICSIIIAGAQNKIALIELRYSVYSKMIRVVSFGAELKKQVREHKPPKAILRTAMITMEWVSCLYTDEVGVDSVDISQAEEHRYSTELLLKQADVLFPWISNRKLKKFLERFAKCLDYLYDANSLKLDNVAVLEEFWTACESLSVQWMLFVMKSKLSGRGLLWRLVGGFILGVRHLFAQLGDRLGKHFKRLILKKETKSVKKHKTPLDKASFK